MVEKSRCVCFVILVCILGYLVIHSLTVTAFGQASSGQEVQRDELKAKEDSLIKELARIRAEKAALQKQEASPQSDILSHQEPAISAVVTRNTTVYSSPTGARMAIVVVPAGSTVEVLEYAGNDFYKVLYSNRRTGYVMDSFDKRDDSVKYALGLLRDTYGQSKDIRSGGELQSKDTRSGGELRKSVSRESGADPIYGNRTLIRCDDGQMHIVLTYLTPDVIEHLWAKEHVDAINELVKKRVNGAVYVEACAIRDTYFSPTRLQFIVGHTSYEVGYGNTVETPGGFGGRVPANTCTEGFVYLPEALDLTKDIDVMYFDSKSRTEFKCRLGNGSR